MTIQNAIDYFKNYIEFCQNDENGTPTLEPYEIAIEAMNKNVPQKPIRGSKGFVCRNCACNIVLDDVKILHCVNCGQAIDLEVME